MRNARTFIAVSALAVTGTLSACSSSSHSAAGGATTGATTAGATTVAATAAAGSGAAGASVDAGGSSAGTSANGGAGAPIDVCASLPAATAKQLSGEDITSAVPSAELVGSGDAGCGYSNDDSTVQVQVQVFVAHGASTWQVATSAKTNTKVSGVGDDAVYDGDGTLYAKKGGTTVQVNGINSADKCAALAKAILAKL